ncbi:MAG: MFS transporter [Victivallales bacterium]|nr:MFS transporter [Victivallales bacterium]
MKETAKKIFKWLPPKRIYSVYVTVSIAELSTGLATPLFTLIFFSQESNLFAGDLSNAKRAMLFGIFLSFYNSAKIISNPLMGSLSDIIGRKKMYGLTIFGMITLSVCTVTALITSSFWLFSIGGFIYAFAWALKAVAVASINDVSLETRKIKNLSLLQFCIGIGMSIGPFISGYIGHITVFGYSYVFPFIILGFFAVFLSFYVRVSVPETLQERNKTPMKEYFTVRNLKEIFGSKVVYLLMLIHILNQLSWGTYYDFIPAVSKTVFNYGVKGVGFIVGIIGVWLIVTTGILLPLIRKYFSNTQLINFSCITGTAGVFIAYISSFFPNYTFAEICFWLSTFPVTVGDVILFCLLVGHLSSVVSKKLQGTIVGLVYILGTSMWVLGAPLGGLLMNWQLNGALLICPVSMSILLMFLYSFQKKEWFLSLNIQKPRNNDY